MMTRYPGATWKPLPQNDRQAHITPTTIVLHSTAGGTLASNWALFDSTAAHGDESHFVVGFDGAVWQVMDTSVRADAQWDANDFAVSIETLSNPKASDPWTPAQLRAVRLLCIWLLGVHTGIGHHTCSSWDSGGLGYHRMFSQWNRSGHTCPGDARVGQFPSLVASIVQGDDMPISQADVTEIWTGPVKPGGPSAMSIIGTLITASTQQVLTAIHSAGPGGSIDLAAASAQIATAVKDELAQALGN
jgi:hypothetical protein